MVCKEKYVRIMDLRSWSAIHSEKHKIVPLKSLNFLQVDEVKHGYRKVFHTIFVVFSRFNHVIIVLLFQRVDEFTPEINFGRLYKRAWCGVPATVQIKFGNSSLAHRWIWIRNWTYVAWKYRTPLYVPSCLPSFGESQSTPNHVPTNGGTCPTKRIVPLLSP